MAAIAIPFILVALEEALLATMATLAAVGAGIIIADQVDKALDEGETDQKSDVCATTECKPTCPPCVPPAGSIAVERIDRVPPSTPHFPCAGDHAHLVQMNQNPRTCNCFWNKAKPDVFCMDGGLSPPYPLK